MIAPEVCCAMHGRRARPEVASPMFADFRGFGKGLPQNAGASGLVAEVARLRVEVSKSLNSVGRALLPDETAKSGRPTFKSAQCLRFFAG
jgi:hypothetical protein